MKYNHILHIFDYMGDGHNNSEHVPNVHNDIRPHLLMDQ